MTSAHARTQSVCLCAEIGHQHYRLVLRVRCSLTQPQFGMQMSGNIWMTTIWITSCNRAPFKNLAHGEWVSKKKQNVFLFFPVGTALGLYEVCFSCLFMGATLCLRGGRVSHYNVPVHTMAMYQQHVVKEVTTIRLYYSILRQYKRL